MSAIPASPSRAGRPPRPRLARGDHEFLPAALEILETPLSPIGSRLILALCGFTAAAVTWAYFGKVDVIATAQGKVQVVGFTKTVQPLETGKVLRIDVRNGQAVRAGEVLVALDADEAQADVASIKGDLLARNAEISRRRSAIELVTRRALTVGGRPAFLPGTAVEVRDRESRVLTDDIAHLASVVKGLEAQAAQKAADVDRLRGTIEAEERLVATLKQRVDMRADLQSHNATPKAAVIDAQEIFQTQLTYLAGLRGQLLEAQAEILTTRHEIEKTFAADVADNSEKLADAERLADEDLRKLVKAAVRVADTVLTSPVDGTVQGLSLTTVGQVVSPGEQIMQIVPSKAALEIEAYLPNADSGFVSPGQAATVKVESFPFTTYGTLDAHVTRVAADAVPQVEASEREENPIASRKPATFGGVQRLQNLVYPVSLALDRTSVPVAGKDVPLTPGMSVTVEVKTGRRRILSFLFSPLIETFSTAMRER